MKDDVSATWLSLNTGSIPNRRAAAIDLIKKILQADGDPATKMALLHDPLHVCRETRVPPGEILSLFDERNEALFIQIALKNALKSKNGRRIPEVLGQWTSQHQSMSAIMPIESVSFLLAAAKESKIDSNVVYLAVIKARGLQDGFGDILDYYQASSWQKDAHALFYLFFQSLLPTAHSGRFDSEVQEFLKSPPMAQEQSPRQALSSADVPSLIGKMSRLLEPGSELAREELFRRVMAKDISPEQADQTRKILLGLSFCTNGRYNRLFRLLMDSEAASKPLVDLVLRERIGEGEATRLIGEYCKARGHPVPGLGEAVPFDPEGLGSCIYSNPLKELYEKQGTEISALVAMRVHTTTEGLTKLISGILLHKKADEVQGSGKPRCPLDSMGIAGARTPSPPQMFFDIVLMREKEPILHGRELGAAITAFLTAA